MTIRIIPRLDIKGPNLVKGVHLEGLRVLGKPEDFAQYYYESGADELFYMDSVASLYGRNSLTEIIEKTVRKVFIPLTVGGGLRTVDDIRTVLLSGADKVSLNTAIINRPEFVREASHRFGSSTIVASIDAIKKTDGTYEAYTDYGRETTGLNVLDWAAKAAELGAGEIMITSIDREGTGKGFDLELTQMVSELVPIPVIACGGAGNVDQVYDVVTRGKADAVSVASILHYNCFDKFSYNSDEFSGEGNIEFLRGKTESTGLPGATIQEIKARLQHGGIDCRP